ncbi:MAG: HupE/UreJ family protein [Actinomycetota bacterium]|nr:HupE/UreJ family protein [Actinomycetota bacterium]
MRPLRTAVRTVLLTTLAAAGAMVIAAEPAMAHTGRPSTGLADGFLHPITGPDHLLAMLAVGVVAALATSRRGAFATPAAFVGGMLIGGVAGVADVPLPGAEALIVASVLLLGVAIVSAVRGAGDWFLVALVVAGVAHGHAHGAEAPVAANVAAYVGGFVAATAFLHAAGAAIGLTVRNHRTLQIGLGAVTIASGGLLVA